MVEFGNINGAQCQIRCEPSYEFWVATSGSLSVHMLGALRAPERLIMAGGGGVPRHGVTPQPGQAELHDTQRATADRRVGAVSQSD